MKASSLAWLHPMPMDWSPQQVMIGGLNYGNDDDHHHIFIEWESWIGLVLGLILESQKLDFDLPWKWWSGDSWKEKKQEMPSLLCTLYELLTPILGFSFGWSSGRFPPARSVFCLFFVRSCFLFVGSVNCRCTAVSLYYIIHANNLNHPWKSSGRSSRKTVSKSTSQNGPIWEFFQKVIIWEIIF